MHRDLQNIVCFFAHTGQQGFRPHANFAERQRCKMNMYPSSTVLPKLMPPSAWPVEGPCDPSLGVALDPILYVLLKLLAVLAVFVSDGGLNRVVRVGLDQERLD